MGGSGWGGFGAAALAFLVAFVATIAGLLVWLELIVREAAIYIAVLFFPLALAASIWPALRMWVRRLSMLLLMFVMLRPVVVIVLALAGSVSSAGLSFGNGSIPHSVGTILAGVVIFALAAFTPWALMFLVGTEIGVLQNRGSATSGAGSGSGSGARREGRLGGAAASGPLLAGDPELAAAGAGAGGGAAADGGGARLASLGGSGANGNGRSSSGPIAAAAGWAGAAGRLGGQLSQHAAARIHVAAGSGGVAPGGPLSGSAGGTDGSSGQRARTASPQPPSPADVPSSGTSSFADSVSESQPHGGSAEPPSPVDSAASPAPPGALRDIAAPPPAESPPAGAPSEADQTGDRPGGE